MKVYLIISSSVYHGEDEVSVTCYNNFELAKSAFDKFVNDTKINDHLVESEECVIDETDTSFTIYENGYYSNDHLNVWIQEKELITKED